MPRGPKPLRSPLKPNQFYCVKCRRRVTVEPSTMCVKVYRNRRTNASIPALRAECKHCDTKLTKFIAVAKKDRYVEKYGRCRSASR